LRVSVAKKNNNEETAMLSWAVTILVPGLIAALFGYTGLAGNAGASADIARIIFIASVLSFVVLTAAATIQAVVRFARDASTGRLAHRDSLWFIEPARPSRRSYARPA
jgi:uncharacterized membrane protein YtjA (UPF0391 family)